MNWLARLLTPEGHGSWRVPPATYYIIRTVDTLSPLFFRLSELETRRLSDKLKPVRIDRPIYICGIARAGTTITLEMISRHPDVGTHYYVHMPVPYLPYWWHKLEETLPLPAMPAVERVHKDGLMVTKDSPEAVEEAFWQKCFPHAHDESRTSVLTRKTANPRFEHFYADHIRKLLLSENRRRYAAKNNYNVTRLAYIQKQFPDAKFVLVIRDPVNHIASLMKQQKIFLAMGEEDPHAITAVETVGHHEFGPDVRLINAGDTSVIQEIRRLWDAGQTVKGWAVYWSSVYGYLADQLRSDPQVARAALVIRYEDLCAHSADTIARILIHAGLSAEPFQAVRDEYVSRLCAPTYYRPDFSERDISEIRKITKDTAQRYGY